MGYSLAGETSRLIQHLAFCSICRRTEVAAFSRSWLDRDRKYTAKRVTVQDDSKMV